MWAAILLVSAAISLLRAKYWSRIKSPHFKIGDTDSTMLEIPRANKQAISSRLFSLRIQNVAVCPAAYFQPQNSDSSGSGQPLSFSYAFLSFFNSQLGLVLRRRPSSHLLFLIYLFLAFITCLGMPQHFPLRQTGFRNDGHAACK